MRTLILSALPLVLFCLAGCTAQDRLDALGHPVWMQGGLYGSVRDHYEGKLHQLLARRATASKVFEAIPVQRELVQTEDFFEQHHRYFDGEPTHIPSTAREEWKRNYRVSWKTYFLLGDDENHMFVYFDALDHLWQYDHF